MFKTGFKSVIQKKDLEYSESINYLRIFAREVSTCSHMSFNNIIYSAMKLFELIWKESFGRDRLKVFIADQFMLPEVRLELNELAFVKEADYTFHEERGTLKEDITVYLKNTFNFDEMKADIQKMLEDFLNK